MLPYTQLTIAFFFVSLVSPALAKQDELPENYKPPYSEPPKLELKFKDDFQKDSRGDYQITGKKDAVTWEKGKLTLGEGAVLQRKLDAGSWVEMELDLEFPKLTEDGQTSEFRIWLDFEVTPDSFISFRQKRESGRTISEISIVDTNGDWNGISFQKPKPRTLAFHGGLENGKYAVGYRSGLFRLGIPKNGSNLLGFIDNRDAAPKKFVLSLLSGSVAIDFVKFWHSQPVELNYPPEAAEQIATLKNLSAQISFLYKTGKPLEAIEIAQKVAKIRFRIQGKFHPNYNISLNDLGVLFKSLGKYEEAESFYLQAKEVVAEVLGREHPNYALCLSNLAVLYKSKGALRKAEPLCLEAYRIRKRVLGTEHPRYGISLINLATLFEETGKYEKAEPLCIEAMETAENLYGKRDPKYATSLNNLAGLYEVMGAYDASEKLLREALEIHDEARNKAHPSYTTILNNLAGIYEVTGRYEQAEKLYLEARDIRDKSLGRKHVLMATSLNNLGVLYQLSGAYEKAEPLLREALEIVGNRLGKEHPKYAFSLINLSGFFRATGAYNEAQPLLIEASRILENKFGKKHPYFSNSLNSLAGVYEEIGDYKKAEVILKEALQLREEFPGKSHPDYATSLNNLASLYATIGELEKAEPRFIEAQQILERELGTRHPKNAHALNNLAMFYKSKGAYEEAEKYYLDARSKHRAALGDKHPDYTHVLFNQALLYVLTGAKEKAEMLLGESLLSTRFNLDRFGPVLSEKRFQNYARSFDERLSFFISNALSLSDRGTAVWDQAVQWKGMSLVRQKRNLILADLPETAETFAELKSIRSQMSKHLKGDPTVEGWQERTNRLEDQEEQLEKRLAAIVKQLGLDLTEAFEANIRIPANTCLVDFRRFDYSEPDADKPGRFVVKPHYLALIRQADNSVEMLDLGSAEKIENTISRWRDPIERSNRNRRPIDDVEQEAMENAGEELRQLLWEPMEKHIGDLELVLVSPDGALGRFPLIALPGKEPGTYLLEEKKIAYSPVPALLPKMLAKPVNAIDLSSRPLLLGGIDYGTRSREAIPDRLSQRNLRLLQDLQFSSLANSGREIDGIQKLFDQSTRLSRREATERAFQANLKDHSVVHLATHGFFQSPERFMKRLPSDDQDSFVSLREQAKVLTENPNLLSGLALANANSAANKSIDQGDNDGILYSAEIAMLPMEHVQLAVLSACETSLGTDDNPGEGLIGIQRAFQVAGAKSTVASYWKVNDKATQMLMNRFYKNLIEYSERAKAKNQDPNSTTVRIDALRDAQLWMLRGLNKQQVAQLTRGPDDKTKVKDIKLKKPKDPKSAQAEYVSHPRYWAAFVLSGDWR